MFPVKLHRVRGIIMHRTSVREQDRMIDMYTREEGRLWCFAPGVRYMPSRRSGHLEPFMETQCTLTQSRRGYTIKDARTIETFPRLRESLNRMNDAYAVIRRLRDHIGEGQKDTTLYDAVRNIFLLLNEYSDNDNISLFIRSAADIHILSSLGMLPDLHRCCVCRDRLKVHQFAEANDTKGGFVCKKCGNEVDETLTDAVRVCRALYAHPGVRITGCNSGTLARVQEMLDKRFGAYVPLQSMRV